MGKRRLWRPILIFLAVLYCILYILPTIVGESGLPSWYPFKKRLSFGLDLQGGLELRYTVDYKRAIAENLLKTKDEVARTIAKALAQRDGKDFDGLSNEEKDAYLKRFTIERADFDSLRVVFQTPQDAEVLNSDLMSEMRSDLVLSTSTDTERVLRLAETRVASIKDEVVAQTLEVIRKRIEAFGLVEPDVRKHGDTDIDIQLPGVRGAQIEEVRKRIGQTARLAFRIVDRNPEIANFFDRNKGALEEFKSKFPEKGRLLKIQKDPVTTQWFVRADAGVRPGPSDALAKNALISFLKTLKLPEDHMVGYELVEEKDGNVIKERYYRTYIVFADAPVSGEHLTRAMVLYETNGEPYVSIEFNPTGAKAFEKVTTENVNEYMAIMLDEDISSAPRIREPIAGGRAKITLGGARHPREILKEAQSLVTVLTHGAYKAPVHKVHDFEVGPSLGRDTIRSGVIALVVAVVAVFLFMLIYYGGAGLIADIGLVLNVLFIIAVLIGFNAALTMPGLAGIVLTVGMAVDANVLIIERMREEFRLGKGPRACVEAGYGKAWSAILDSNVTTAIAGVVLLNYSSGPVYGFAVTLLIGIVATLITQVWVTRVIYDYYLDRARPEKLSLGI